MFHSPRLLHLLQLGRWAEALRIIDTALAQRPDDAHLHYFRSIALAGLTDLRESRRAAERAIALRPNVADYHAQRGEVLHRIRMSVAAHKSFERALQLDPDSIAVKASYAHSILVDPRLDQAFVQLKLKRRVRELGSSMMSDAPDDPTSHYVVARVQLMDKQLDAAERSCREVLRLAPNWAPGHELHGDVLDAQGRAGEAGEAYLSSGKLDPTTSTSRLRLRKLVRGDGPLDERSALAILAIIPLARFLSEGAHWWAALLLFVIVVGFVIRLIARHRAKLRSTRESLSPQARLVAEHRS